MHTRTALVKGGSARAHARTRGSALFGLPTRESQVRSTRARAVGAPSSGSTRTGETVQARAWTVPLRSDARLMPAPAGRRPVGHRWFVKAAGPRKRSREVILAAGAVGSPQILQLSGVGPGALLQARGVDVGPRTCPGSARTCTTTFKSAASTR